MADDQVVTNIVARADFSDLIANVRKVTTSLAAMQQQIGSSNKVLSSQINAVNRSFGETLRSTGQFSSHFVSLANDVDVFGKRLDGGKLKLRDYFSTLQTHTRTSGGLIRDLARQQVQLQNAILQPLGRNAQGLMQFNVHVPQGLDEIKNKGAIARQEMQILNKVMQEGAGQLINWGKNTQWAGRQLTVGLTVPIAAFGAAAAKAFREADQELTRLTKVYGGLSATSSTELQKVRRDVTAVANELARGYGASFKETLALSADIAATGKQGSELLGSIRETTRLAVLGEVDRQDAMKATLAIQSAFKQDTDELAQSINFLNAVENQTSTTLNDLVEAIPKAGPVIKGLGGDVQDLALYLTAMREGGINASEGANALKSALASLINPTDVAVKKFEGFGIDLMGIVNNNAGDITKTLFALQAALDNLNPLQKSQAIEQLFGKFQFARLSALFENLGKQGSQTLQVMDLMKASSKELATIASRELSMVTESASGKYKRAVEGLKADLAGIGEEFLKVSTFFINLVDGIVKFVNNLPGPIKTILTFLAGLTAVTGPLIMLTGVLANFLGYVIKGAFHLKALFKGGEGWRMLTPEILAANQAGSLIEKTFYSDAKAALALAEALQVLSAGMTSIQSKMTQGVVSVQPLLSTVAGSVIKPPDDDGGGGGGGGIPRIVDPRNPLVGPAGTRASAHMVPRSGMTQEERAAQTIHSFLPAPIPVNQAIGANPQIFASGDLPSIPGLTTIAGKTGPVSTGVVSSEAAKWHTMVGSLSMMTKTEVAQMRTQLRTTGTVSSEFTQAFGSLLPQMTSIAQNAAQQSAIIVAEAKAGTISVQVARQRIIALNIQVEQLMAQATMGTAASLGRTAVLTGVPTLDQPVVDPKTGKSNMRELFKKGKTRSFVDDLARLMGVRTWGAGYSTHTTRPIRLNMGGKVYNPEVHGNVVPGDTSINYDNTPAVLREGGFILNQSSSRVNPDLVKLAKNSKNAGGKIVPAILTPGETYFPPEIAQEIMPTLEKANSGSVVKLLNAGGILGGRVSNKKLNYGIRISPLDILSKLGRWNPNMARGARRVYETRASGSRASNSPRTFDPGSQFGPETYHSLFRRSSATWGVHGGALRHGERGADEVLGHVITSKFLRQFRGLPEQGSSRVLTGSQFESRFGSMPGGATPSKVYQVLPDNLITITKDFNAALINGSATGAMWLSSSRQPQHFISLLSHLLNSGVPYKVAYRTAGRTLDRINKAMYRLKDTNLTETKWGNIVDSSMQAEISALSRSYTKGSMHSLNAGGTVPGGMVSRNRFGYGIPALAASAIARLTSKWKKPNPYSPATQKHDWTNTDPLHGPLFIGRADIGSDGVRRSLSYKIPSGRVVQGREGKQLVGISPMFSNDPRYLIERYMAGDKSVLARMQYESRNGLNTHPLSIQSLFRLLARPFRGTLYRGMTPQSVADTLPKHVVEAIEKARATGDFSALIGKAFIMRRASFTANRDIASFFAPGRSSGPMSSLLMEARLFGRKVTPTSEIFPDKKFQAPYGQDWSKGLSSRRYRSEQESLVGGRFTITGFDGKKLIVEGRAMGGPVSGGTPYVVGERGPELFVPKNSGGIIPSYALGGIVKGGKINYGELPPGWEQALAQPTLATQMRASGQLPPLQTPQALETPKGPRGLGALRMLGSLGGGTLGSMVGTQLTGGSMVGNILGFMGGSALADAGITSITNKVLGLGNAAGTAAGKTSLLTKAFNFFIKLPGPLKLLAAIVGVGVAIETINNKISEHRRIVSSGFGISEESAKKLGLQYKKLGSEIDTYQQKYDLMLAKAAANRFNQTKAEGKGINITVPELEKLKKQVAKDFPDEIKMFDKATNEEAIERATNLKAGMVAAGKSVEEANEIILAMIMNSNKSAYALDILGDRGFGKIQGKVSATNATIKTFSNIIKEGNFDQLPIALQTSVNALDNLQQSFIKIDINTKKAVTSSQAYEKVLSQISGTANKQIGEKGLEEILAQNEGLRDVIDSTDTLAGIWAKIKLSTSGITFNLKDMSSETATTISLLLEQQKDYLRSNDSLIGSAADLIAKTGNITANQLIKNANKTKESIQKEIELRQKNIQRIKDEADAKKKALDEETEAEDFLLQIQKKQIEYSEALASGDMARAAQAQLDIQSMTGARQLDLAKTAIDNKADRDIKKQQDLIDNLTKALDGLSKTLEKQISAAGNEQAKKADMQGLYDLFMQAVTLGMGGVTDSEKLIIGDIAKTLRDSGIKQFVDLADKYLKMSPTGPYVGRAQAMGFGALESLGAASFSVISGKLQVQDTATAAAIEKLASGKNVATITNLIPSKDPSTKNLVITMSDYLESGIYAPGSPSGKQFLGKDNKLYRIVRKQQANDNLIVEPVEKAMGGIIKNFMPGGNVTGPGTGTSDSIPAMLSNGEYVIKADSVKKYGKDTFDALNSGRFADGGPVNASALITPSVPYYMNMGGEIPGYFDGGSVFSKLMKSAISPFGAAGFGLDILSKIDTYRKNKDLNKWVDSDATSGQLVKSTLNPEAKSIYVYDMANRYDSKDRRPVVNQALKYLTGQTGVQFKRATFGMRNNPDVVKLDWSDPQSLLDSGAAGSAAPESRYVNLTSPFGANAFTLGRKGGQNLLAHEILHSLGIGDYSQPYGELTNDSKFHGHAKNPFNVMFPWMTFLPGFVSKSDTEQLRRLTDFYNFDFKDIPTGKAMGGMVSGYHEGGPVGHRHGRNAPKTMGPYGPYVPTFPAGPRSYGPYGPYVPSFPTDKRSNMAKAWDFLKEAAKETGRSIEWTIGSGMEAYLNLQDKMYPPLKLSPESQAKQDAEALAAFNNPRAVAFRKNNPEKWAEIQARSKNSIKYISEQNRIMYDQIAAMRAAGMDSEANKAFAMKTAWSGVNTGSLFLGGALGSATARGLVEAYGINKFGTAGLGTLLPTGSIRYGTKVAAGAAANLGTAAAIGLGKPFAESKITSLLAPKIKITAGVTNPIKKANMTDWVEHQGRKVPIYTGGPFGEKRIVWQGAGDDFSELVTNGSVDRVIPTNARGILEYLVSQKPKDKKLAAMLANFQPGKRPGKAEAEFLKKMLAITSFGPKTFTPETLMSELPTVYLNKIKSEGLDIGMAKYPMSTVYNLPKSTREALDILKAEEDAKSTAIREMLNISEHTWDKLQAQSTSDLGLLGTPDTEGLATLMSSMLGDKSATAQVTARLKMLTPYLNQAKLAYEAQFAVRGARNARGVDDTFDVDLSQIPMIRSAKYGYQKDEFGNITEENPGYNIYEHLFAPSGNTNMALSDARVTQHWTMWDVVRAGAQHMDHKWDPTEPVIVTTLKNLLKTSDFESYGTYDAWRTASFLDPHKVLKGSFSEVQGYTTKKEYIEELMKLGLYKDGDPLKLMYTDPATNRVLYQLKPKYSNKDLEELMKLMNEDDFLPTVERVKPSDRTMTDFEHGEGVFQNSGRVPGRYSVERIQRMLAIRQAQKQIGIDIPYSQMPEGASENINPHVVNAIANMTGTDIGGLHANSSLMELARMTTGSSNPFSSLLNQHGTKSTDAAMSALLMHTYFGKFSSKAYDADYKLTVEQRVSKLLESWVRHQMAYKYGDTKIPPMSEKEFLAKEKAIRDSAKDFWEQDAEGGYISPENHITRLKKQGLNIPKFNEGGMATTYNVPKFENGINMVPADMLAMLHKNEAVVPANMNPFNPNAQSYSQPSISYNIAPVINAAPGMDEQAIANMATRQVLAEIKAIDSRNTASIGRQGMRVVGNK